MLVGFNPYDEVTRLSVTRLIFTLAFAITVTLEANWLTGYLLHMKWLVIFTLSSPYVLVLWYPVLFKMPVRYLVPVAWQSPGPPRLKAACGQLFNVGDPSSDFYCLK